MPRVAIMPPVGIVRGPTPEANNGRWWDGNNVRFRDGQPEPIGGNVAVPATFTPTVARDVLSWHSNDHKHWVAFGTDDKLYAYLFDTQVAYDITPAGVGGLDPPGALLGYGLADYGESAYGTARDAGDIGPGDTTGTLGDQWSMDTFGEDLLIVPTQDGHLYRWTPTTPTVLPVIVAGAPLNNRSVIVTDQRHVVLLGAGGDPRNVAWSDQENPNVWNPLVDNLAGSKLLSTQGMAMTANKVSDGILIFTTNDVHKMTYVGSPYAYGIVQIATGCGPISSRAVVGIGNVLAWPGQQSFWTYAGNVQAMPCDVGGWFFDLINRAQVGRVFGTPNPAFSEMWDFS